MLFNVLNQIGLLFLRKEFKSQPIVKIPRFLLVKTRIKNKIQLII